MNPFLLWVGGVLVGVAVGIYIERTFRGDEDDNKN